VRAYARDLRDYFDFLESRELLWDRVVSEDLGRFVSWLRLPGGARDGRVAVLPWVNPDLSAATARSVAPVSSIADALDQWRGGDCVEVLLSEFLRTASNPDYRRQSF
jgi:hypothetical protein